MNITSPLAYREISFHTSLPEKSGNTTQDLIQHIFESSSDVIVGCDNQGFIRYWNKQYEHFFDPSMKQMKGRHCSELFGETRELCRACGQSNCYVGNHQLNDMPQNDLNLKIKQIRGEDIFVNLGIFNIPASSQHNLSMFISIRKINTSYVTKHTQNNSVGTVASPLTKRQHKILKLAANGMQTHHIAEHLSLSLETVRNHFKNIYCKLDVHSRSEAVVYAIKNNLV